jgi:peptide-methionine (S)-S-oxide reductase
MTDSAKLETIVLGGGCFWCTEAVFQRVEGVSSVVSGYAGGHVANPTYEQVSAGNTGHAEVDEITFDPSVISLHDILEIFFVTHDPTTPGRQGNDVGPQYRSVVLYSDPEQKQAAEDEIKEIKDFWPNPIITEIVPLDKFYRAEDYHQNYFNNNPQQGYCQVVINPKLAKLRQKFASKLKKDA